MTTPCYLCVDAFSKPEQTLLLWQLAPEPVKVHGYACKVFKQRALKWKKFHSDVIFVGRKILI